MIVKKMFFQDFLEEFDPEDRYSVAQLRLIFNDQEDLSHTSTHSGEPYYFVKHEILQDYVPYATVFDAVKDIFGAVDDEIVTCEKACLELLQEETVVLFNLETENSGNKYRDIVVRAF